MQKPFSKTYVSFIKIKIVYSVLVLIEMPKHQKKNYHKINFKDQTDQNTFFLNEYLLVVL